MNKLFVVIMFFSSLDSYSQQYMLVASYRPKGDGCKDRILVQLPLQSLEECNAKRRTFYKEYDASSADIWCLSSNEVAIVYEFKTKIPGFDCEYTAHGISKGKTVEEATQSRNKLVAENPKTYITTPEPKLTWVNGSSKDVLKKKYKNGVEVEYILAKQQSGKTTMLVKAINTNKDVDVILKFESIPTATGIGNYGPKISPVEITAGGRVSTSIPADTYDVKFEYKARKDAPTDIKKIIMDYMKQATKEMIGVNKEGKISDGAQSFGERH